MKFRVLQHEKDTAFIRIGAANDVPKSIDEIGAIIIEGYKCKLGVKNPDFGKFWKRIAIVDDILTTGAHFKACKTVLQERFPEAQIFGIFIA
jgi:adenine/guanine phosphoribosyltransferase-like PRPP-binding protein